MRKGAHFIKPEPKGWLTEDLQEEVRVRTGSRLRHPERLTRDDLALLNEAFVRTAKARGESLRLDPEGESPAPKGDAQ